MHFVKAVANRSNSRARSFRSQQRAPHRSRRGHGGAPSEYLAVGRVHAPWRATNRRHRTLSHCLGPQSIKKQGQTHLSWMMTPPCHRQEPG